MKWWESATIFLSVFGTLSIYALLVWIGFRAKDSAKKKRIARFPLSMLGILLFSIVAIVIIQPDTLRKHLPTTAATISQPTTEAQARLLQAYQAIVGATGPSKGFTDQGFKHLLNAVQAQNMDDKVQIVATTELANQVKTTYIIRQGTDSSDLVLVYRPGPSSLWTLRAEAGSPPSIQRVG